MLLNITKIIVNKVQRNEYQCFVLILVLVKKFEFNLCEKILLYSQIFISCERQCFTKLFHQSQFQFQPNTSVAVASIRTFLFSVLNITIIYKTIFLMPAIP